ncbi:FecCD family ABC transporter permease [Staphylococcus massiliensis]|uniref:Iron ABC transporter permease n=1 Tax=Staphylococcus massiliensis S46 TaxID=1229783 RepID=K9ATT7_9STAP|nr:iron ABC transporter permease [Staphylococcus massiliensis]EKU46017.1 iron ABC transporter permease [Staphylococcus massiliensis S46]MCG3400285.1 iron ABC transporter permease [Staphylococcus massiliensis]MCG3401915.1 iron ABC transporter permease [Staphylococcus massiliensis]MCG3412423.1 iron ABC transporter permease [Staphylococcus massiliensis]PNZ98004.1 iron ABC transporter permease [Staphylococcus massiliensis CCUG 55927]
MRFKTFILWGAMLLILIGLTLFYQLGDLHEPISKTILLEVRLPRLLLAMLSGMGLTLAGHLFQLILRNPLADSFTLGLASGATFGSGLAVILGASYILISLFSIVFSLLSLALVLSMSLLISRYRRTETLIITGVMIGALFNAFLYVLIQFNQNKLNSLMNYMFGSFGSAEYKEVLYVCIMLIVTLFIVVMLLPNLKLLQVDTLKQTSLGMKVSYITHGTLLIASILSSVIIAQVGIIGFIGMIVPQLVRYLYRVPLGVQIALNVLIGGVIMLIADFIGGYVFGDINIPASIILSLIGIPVLFYLLLQQKPLR